MPAATDGWHPLTPQRHSRLRWGTLLTGTALTILLIGATNGARHPHAPPSTARPATSSTPANRQSHQPTSHAPVPLTGKILENSIGMKLVRIPAGQFQMGCKSDRNLRLVKIARPFYMGAYEVTQQQYQAIVGTNPARHRGARFPVEQVSWEEAVAFCDRLSQKEGRDYRLPTEAEWEYACRAGTSTPFSFGSSLNGRQANCNGGYPYGMREKGPSLERTAQVGSYAPNPFGLYDMHGNVMEWCAYWGAPETSNGRPADADAEPAGPIGSGHLTFCAGRGGSWIHGAQGCCSTVHMTSPPGARYPYWGFRVVLVAP